MKIMRCRDRLKWKRERAQGLKNFQKEFIVDEFKKNSKGVDIVKKFKEKYNIQISVKKVNMVLR